MRKPASILIAAVVIAASIVTGASPASANNGHSIAINNATVSEGGSATFTLTVAPAPEAGETVSVDIASANGSALAATSCPAAPGSPSSDFVRVPNTTITWAAGESTKQRTVATCEDASGEGDETYFINLSDAKSTCTAPCTSSSVSIGDFQGAGSITDDEDTPALQIADRTAVEGPVGTTTFTFPVTLSSPTSKAVTVKAATRNGTATSTDYASRNVTLTFPANSTAPQNIDVSVTGDAVPETDETFFVDLSEPANAKISDPQGVGLIRNDDPLGTGSNTLVIDDVTRGEGNTGAAPTTPFTFTVTLGRSPSAGQTATVNFHVTEGNASSGADYIFTSGTLVFAPGETAETISVPVLGDTTPESNETFNVVLSGADCTAATSCDAPGISDAQGRGTINNDDTTGPTPTPTPTPAPDTISPRSIKVGGYFQARVTADSPCQAGRLIKVKKVVSGTDKVMVDGTTDAGGSYKEAVRPKKSGRFYAQVYTFTRDGKTCRGGKSPVRTLPA
jgi:large repetitive protein